nr:hypothetical protein [Tanacetum cinerariifolium]
MQMIGAEEYDLMAAAADLDKIEEVNANCILKANLQQASSSVEHTGWKLRRKQWTGTTDQLIEDLEAAYDKAPNMFSIQIHHGGKFQSYPSRMYVSGRVDIFDMVGIDLFAVVALNMMVLKKGYTGKSEPMFYNYLRPLTSLDEGLYALACEEDVRFLATLVRSFKETLEEINDQPVGSIAANITEKMLLLTWHESSETLKEPVCDSVTPSSLPQADCILTPPTDESVITYTQLSGVQGVIDDVMRQLSFDETELDGEACFADVAGSDVDSSGLSHDESFRVDDLDLNLNEEPDEPILVEVSIEESIVACGRDYVSSGEDVAQYNGEFNELARNDGQFFFDDEGIDTKYDVQSSEDAGTDDDDDDVDEDLLVDEENEIVEPDVDVHLFGINMDLPFDNIGVTNLVSNDVLEGEDVDVINPDGFDTNHGNDEETHYRKRRLAQLRTEMGVKAVQDQLQYELEVQISMSKAFRAKAKAEREIRGDNVLIYVCLGALKLGFRACRRDLLGLNGAFMDGSFPGQVLVAVGLDSNNGIYPLAYALVETESKSSWCWFLQCLSDDIDLHPNLNFIFINDRQKGIIPTIKIVYPSAEHRYCLRHVHENIKQGWCGQAYKDLLWRAPSTTNVRDFEKAKYNLLLNNICEVFNGKIVGGRDKPVITLLEYIREYYIKRIMNVQGVIDKCTGPLTLIATKIMESIKKEAHLMKELTRIPCKHVVVAFWNMALNDRATPPTNMAVQGGSGGSGVGVVIGLSTDTGEGGQGGAGVASQGSSHSRWTKSRVQTERMSPQKRIPTQPASQPSTSSQVPVSETRNANGREIAGSESHPPMLNKENYVPWSSRLLRYAKSRPNGKLIHNSILIGPYVRKMIPEPDIYAAVDSCETAQEIWLRVQQMMKGSDIEFRRRRPSCSMNGKEWSRHVTIVYQTKDLHTADYTQLYDFLKYNQKELDELKAERLAKTQDPLALMENSNNLYAFLAPHQDQSSFNQNYLQQPMPNPEDITDPTTVIQNAVQNPRVQNIRNHNGLIGVQGNENQNQIGNEKYDLMAVAADLDEIEEVNANCILMANLQQVSTSGTQTDSAPVYDTDGSAEVHEICDDNKIFNMFTQEEQYTELLEPIPESHQVPQNDNDVISEDTSMEQGGETVEQHPTNFEETRALYESLYQNLAIEVEKVKSTIVTLQRVVKQRMTIETHNWASSTHQELHKIIRDENFPIVNQVDARLQNFEIQFLKEAAKFVGDFKSLAKEADDSLALRKTLELKIELLQTELERMKERFENCIIKKKTEYAKLWNDWYKKCDECKYDKISYDKAYKDMQQKIKRLQAQLGDLKGKSKDKSCVSDTRKPLSHKLENENVELEFQDSSENTKFAKQPIMENLPKIGETNALSKPVTSNLVSTPQESKGVNNDKVTAPGMFRIDHSKTSKKEKDVPNTVSASNRTKPITVSQPPVITKKDVNSDLNGLSSTRVDNTKTRRPQPRSNTKHDRVLSASKSSQSKNKEAEVEEHHRNLLLSKNNKHISSA